MITCTSPSVSIPGPILKWWHLQVSPLLRQQAQQHRRVLLSGALGMLLLPSAMAIDIVGYDPAVNDRFDPATFPSTLSPNPNANFVAAGYDLSSLSFNPVPFNGRYLGGYALITPVSVLSTAHTGVSGPVTFFGTGGQLTSVNFSGSASLWNTGDPAIGILATRIDSSSGVSWAPVLDLATKVNGQTNYDNWAGQPALVSGRNGGPDFYSGDFKSPRMALTTIDYVQVSVSDTFPMGILAIKGPSAGGTVQYIGGDSSGPTYIPWTDPSGAKILTVAGTHWSVGGSSANLDNFFGSDQALSAMNNLTRSKGYAVQMVGDASRYWVGGNGTNFTQNATWTGGVAPDDYSYVGFDKSQATSQAVTLAAGSQARGLVFSPTSAGDVGFTLSGGDLTLGRGGMINYSTRTQNIASQVTLADDQWWIARAGDLRVSGNINTNGKLLIVDGPHNSTLSGTISGVGGSLAKEGTGTLTVSGSDNTYTGTTYIHSGTLKTTGQNSLGSGQLVVESTGTIIIGQGSSFGNELFLQAGSGIGGTGRYAQTVVLDSGRTVRPGDEPTAIGKFRAAGFNLAEGGIFELQIARDGGTGPIVFDSIESFFYNMNITATQANPFVLKLDSLGDITLGLQPNETVSWAFLTTGTRAAPDDPIILGFSADKFLIDHTNFLPDGSFSLTQSGKTVSLNFTAVPEPSAAALLVCAAGLYLWRRNRSGNR